MKQSDKDKFDVLMRIADFQIRQFNERRDYSWKITFGFWGAILGSVAIINPYRACIPLPAIASFGGLVILIHTWWLYNVFHADKKDKDKAFEARNKAMEIIGLPTLKDESDRKFYCDWSAQVQFAITFLLVVIVIVAIKLL